MSIFRLFRLRVSINNLHFIGGLQLRNVHEESGSSPNKRRKEDNDYIENQSGDSTPDKITLCICGVWSDGDSIVMTPTTASWDKSTNGKVFSYIKSIWNLMDLGKAFPLPGVGDSDVLGLAYIGPKNPSDYDPQENLDRRKENLRWGLGAATSIGYLYGSLYGHYAYDECDQKALDAIGEVGLLGDWCPDDSNFGRFNCGPYLLNKGRERACGQNWARFICEKPPNVMKPVDLAKEASRLTEYGVKVETHNRDWIVKQGMEAFLTVADSSCSKPIFVECIYNGAGAGKPPVLLTTSGITYDSGGFSLQRPQLMTDHRVSIAGAAVALGTMYVVARQKIPVNVACVIPLCQNMISGQCLKVGDVVKVGSKYIQVDRTDLEGSLLIADALEYGQKVYKPSLVLNVATLTCDAGKVTGSGAFGCFTNNERAWQCMKMAGASSGDRPWRLPVWDYYQKQVTKNAGRYKSLLINHGSDEATSCVNAAFLKNFMHCDWVHCDITGVSKVDNLTQPLPYLNTKYATGRPTRTLIQFLEGVAGGCLTN